MQNHQHARAEAQNNYFRQQEQSTADVLILFLWIFCLTDEDIIHIRLPVIYEHQAKVRHVYEYLAKGCVRANRCLKAHFSVRRLGGMASPVCERPKPVLPAGLALLRRSVFGPLPPPRRQHAFKLLAEKTHKRETYSGGPLESSKGCRSMSSVRWQSENIHFIQIEFNSFKGSPPHP